MRKKCDVIGTLQLIYPNRETSREKPLIDNSLRHASFI